MPPPLWIHRGERLRISVRPSRLRFEAATDASVFERLDERGFVYLEVRPSDVFDLEVEVDTLRVGGAFHAPYRARWLGFGPLAVAEAEAAARALSGHLRLPRIVEPVREGGAPGARWAALEGIRYRAHFESADFRSAFVVKLSELPGVPSVPYDVPVTVIGRLMVPTRRLDVPPPVGWGGPWLTVVDWSGTGR